MASQPSQTQTQTQTQTGHKSRLLNIALEVLLQITSYLTTPEYGNLRLVCRHLDASLFKAFAHEFFTKKAFMLTEFSLQALVDISTSRFASSLKYLIIDVQRPRPASSFQVPNDIARDIARDIGREHYCSHRSLISSGQDVELIAEALRNLPNLETFGLRDFPSGGRHRDGGNAFWHAYGASTILRQTSAQLSRPDFLFPHHAERQSWADTDYISHVFLASLRALKQAKTAQSPTRLEVILRHSYLPDLAFYMPRHVEQAVLPVLQDLKVLYLDLGRLTFPTRIVKKGATIEAFPGLLLAVFLSKLQSLKHLRLNFRDCSQAVATPFLKWLAQSPLDTPQNSTPPTDTQAAGIGSELQTHVPQLPQAPSLLLLEELDIGMVDVDSVTLLNILRRYRSSLRKIRLHKVTLRYNTSAGRAIKCNLWVRFLSQTTKLGINITTIELSELSQSDTHRDATVQFRDSSNTSTGKPVFTKKWSGNDWGRSSKDLIDSIIVTLAGSDDEDDEDDDEMDEINEFVDVEDDIDDDDVDDDDVDDDDDDEDEDP
ncbi:hypothetical protein GGR53DRAFT_520857 [Hypoxylon sp. FL1150]|nr:hypothetical protein GGR53DRAFT_520857 [Hypoxylon sp. FL1150]